MKKPILSTLAVLSLCSNAFANNNTRQINLINNLYTPVTINYKLCPENYTVSIDCSKAKLQTIQLAAHKNAGSSQIISFTYDHGQDFVLISAQSSDASANWANEMMDANQVIDFDKGPAYGIEEPYIKRTMGLVFDSYGTNKIHFNQVSF